MVCLSACQAPMSVTVCLRPSIQRLYLCTCAPMCQHPVSGSLGLRDLLTRVHCKILLRRLAGYVQSLLQPLKKSPSSIHRRHIRSPQSPVPAPGFRPSCSPFSIPSLSPCCKSRFVLRFAKLLLFIFLIVFQNTHHFHLRTILPKEIR